MHNTYPPANYKVFKKKVRIFLGRYTQHSHDNVQLTGIIARHQILAEHRLD